MTPQDEKLANKLIWIVMSPFILAALILAIYWGFYG